MSPRTVERDTGVGNGAHTRFLNSVKITEQIFEKIIRRAHGIPVVGFLVGSGPVYGPEYARAIEEIARRQQIILMDRRRACGINRGKSRSSRSGGGRSPLECYGSPNSRRCNRKVVSKPLVSRPLANRAMRAVFQNNGRSFTLKLTTVLVIVPWD